MKVAVTGGIGAGKSEFMRAVKELGIRTYSADEINAELLRDKRYIEKLSAVGHSGFAEEGKDIVCASISSLVQALNLGLNKVLNIKTKTDIDEKKARMEIEMPKDLKAEVLDKAMVLFETVILSLKELEKEFPKHINIKEIK